MVVLLQYETLLWSRPCDFPPLPESKSFHLEFRCPQIEESSLEPSFSEEIRGQIS